MPGGGIPSKWVEVVDTFNAGALLSLASLGVLKKRVLRHIPADDLEAALEFGGSDEADTVSRHGAIPPRAGAV